jgi:hypothetical protein
MASQPPIMFLNEIADYMISHKTVPNNKDIENSNHVKTLFVNPKMHMEYHFVNYLVGRVSCNDNVKLSVAVPHLLSSLIKSQAEYFILWVDGKPTTLFGIIPSTTNPIVVMPQKVLNHYLRTMYYYPRA